MSGKNAFYAQSGGVTAVINATACGVIETARKHKNRISNVYAGRNGIIGALTEDMIDTNRESARNIAALRHTPGGAFGSARYKLKSLEENRREEDCEEDCQEGCQQGCRRSFQESAPRLVGVGMIAAFTRRTPCRPRHI